jgi:predicted ribosome-associated RNA-binding protein Tma20
LFLLTIPVPYYFFSLKNIEPQKIPQVSPADVELVVDESCGLAVLRGADVFIPGILALPPATQPGTMVQNSGSNLPD